MKKRLILVFIFTLLLSLIACSGIETETKKEELENLITIKPVDLFAGDVKKFEPFLGSFSGAVHIKYAGKMSYLEAKFDIWENGEKTQSIGGIGVPLDEIDGKYLFDKEIITSINQLNLQEKPSYHIIKTAITDDSGSSSYEFFLEKDEKYTGFSTLTLHEPIQLAENELAYVWGMQATNKNSLRSRGLMKEDIAETDWALVLTIELSDESM